MSENTKGYWTGSSDKYGRRVQTYRVAGRVVGVVVKLPKSYTEVYGEEKAYLSNDWSHPRTDTTVQYHPTLKDGMRRIESVA